MEYLLGYNLFESNNKETIRIVQSIEDIFFEFIDNKFKVSISEDESIHWAPETKSLIFGKNFVYPTSDEKRWNRLPGMYNNDWKLGFIVTLTIEAENYYNEFDAQVRLSTGRSRSSKVKIKRELDSMYKKFNDEIEKYSYLIKAKANMINQRIPNDIILFGIKQHTEQNIIHYDFAFIYKEYMN